ncbi:hypothetical protein ACFL27_12225 [candidate division CSSED10-310 bacterium]|uniref:Uncharacterized protein n=1 Tax=candidate division CSSED10-310 bacterium TaxID=2855610 RepID=A0ABV6YXP0_UNCC1
MSQKSILSTVYVYLICIAFLSSGQLSAQEKEGEIIIIISEWVGKEIDQQERDKYKLFQAINGFRSAVYIKLPDSRYFLKITYLDEKTGEFKISRFQQSEASIKNHGDYIDSFEKIQAGEIDLKYSQNSEMNVDNNPGTSFYFEMFGKGLFSLNVDHRINKSRALSLGISGAEDGILPSVMYYHFQGEKYRLETGIGFSVILTQSEGCVGVLLNGVIGYRYQNKDGLIFRIGFTPLVVITSKILPLPFAGVSIGYSF